MAKNKLLEYIDWELPWLASYQEDLIFTDKRFSVIEASTKAGKTIGCLLWLVNKAVTQPTDEQRIYRWVAPVDRQVKVAWNRIKNKILDDFPKETQNGIKLWEKWEDPPRTIEFANKARIEFHTGENPDSLYGEDVWAAVIDEFTRCKSEVWDAVRTTITSTQAPVRFIGNVVGRNNWGYRLAREVENGERSDRWKYGMITAWDAVEEGVLPPEEIIEAKGDMEDWKFAMLYECVPPPSGQNPFGIENIREICRTWDTHNGLAEGKPYAWGWDVAEAENFTVGIALNRDGEVCRFHRFQSPWGVTADRMVQYTGRNKRAYVDATGVGKPLMEMLRERGAENFKGFTFTGKSKQELMTTLGTSIQANREENRPKIPKNSRIQKELESFEFEQTRTRTRYSAPEGMHDDCVDALALAVKRWKERASLPESINMGGRESRKRSHFKGRIGGGTSTKPEILKRST